MRISFAGKWILLLPVVVAATARAYQLDASLDRYEITLAMDRPTVLQVTLRNRDSAAIYLTGVKVSLSEGATGDVYNPALIHEIISKLGAGQSWGGPLIVLRANHRGPLVVKGAIRLTGGSKPDAVDSLASIPLSLTIDDARREKDGSYDRSSVPVCDRSSDTCCDPSETNCFHIQDQCVYVSEGYDRQDVCVNQRAEKTYERITDVRVSTDAAHIAYLANFKCLSAGPEEHCQRAVVLDHQEISGPEMATHLSLSPDGHHVAYLGRQACVWRSDEETCTGAGHPFVDGIKVDVLPDWYSSGN